MATFTAIRNAKQTAGTLAGVLRYITQDEKTRIDDLWLVTGSNCVAQSAYTEMLTTKQHFKKLMVSNSFISCSPFLRTKR